MHSYRRQLLYSSDRSMLERVLKYILLPYNHIQLCHYREEWGAFRNNLILKTSKYQWITYTYIELTFPSSTIKFVQS